MAVYDSAKTRGAGRLLKQLAADMDGNVMPAVRDASGCLESFRGRTAQAMEEQMDQLLKAAAGLQGEMEELAHRIMVYADLLEQADNELAEKL